MMAKQRELNPGDLVVYFTSKQSNKPSNRAVQVHPSRYGEGYGYQIKKYWIVQEVDSSGSVTVRTRRGKVRSVDSNDHCLRRANLFEKLFQRNRFPKTDTGVQAWDN